MTAKELNALLDELNLSQVGLARLLGFTDRTARRYASGDKEIPYYVEAFLKLLAHYKIKPAHAHFVASGDKIEPRFFEQGHIGWPWPRKSAEHRP